MQILDNFNSSINLDVESSQHNIEASSQSKNHSESITISEHLPNTDRLSDRMEAIPREILTTKQSQGNTLSPTSSVMDSMKDNFDHHSNNFSPETKQTTRKNGSKKGELGDINSKTNTENEGLTTFTQNHNNRNKQFKSNSISLIPTLTRSPSQVNVSEHESIINPHRGNSVGRSSAFLNPRDGQERRRHRSNKSMNKSRHSDCSVPKHGNLGHIHQLSCDQSAGSPSSSHESVFTICPHSLDPCSGHCDVVATPGSTTSISTFIMTCILVLGVSPGMIMLLIPMLLLLPLILVGSIPMVVTIPLFLTIKRGRQEFEKSDKISKELGRKNGKDVYRGKVASIRNDFPNLLCCNTAHDCNLHQSQSSHNPALSDAGSEDARSIERFMTVISDAPNISDRNLASLDEDNGKEYDQRGHRFIGQSTNTCYSDHQGITSPEFRDPSQTCLLFGEDSTEASSYYSNQDGDLLAPLCPIQSKNNISTESRTTNLQQCDNTMLDTDFDIQPILALVTIILMPILSFCCVPILFCLPLLLLLLIPILLIIPIVILLSLPFIGGLAFFCSIVLSFFLPWRSMWQTSKQCFNSTINVINSTLKSIFNSVFPYKAIQ